MSLEQTLIEATEAMKALTIALAAHHVPAKAATTTGPAPAAPAAAAKTPAVAAKTQGGALDYEKDVKPLTLRVAKEKSRDKVVEILAKFGVTHANMLKPEQFGEYITACNTALSAK